MAEKRNAGLIECGPSTNPYEISSNSEFDGFHLKKVLVKQKITDRLAEEYYPQAEIVEDINSIINDKTIELVIVSEPGDADLNLVAEALEAGKQVRVL
jgi:predicted dehydrogenase